MMALLKLCSCFVCPPHWLNGKAVNEIHLLDVQPKERGIAI